MSDLKPLTLPEGADLAQLEEAAVPYPFGNVGTDTPLLLYFEVYHLLFAPETDRTRYTVEYEVTQRGRRSGLGRLFSGDDEKVLSQTSTTATYEGVSSRAQEYISLDLGALEADESGEVEVLVRVTDETNGTEVERTLTFDLRPAE
jgi:hypothetical protein